MKEKKKKRSNGYIKKVAFMFTMGHKGAFWNMQRTTVLSQSPDTDMPMLRNTKHVDIISEWGGLTWVFFTSVCNQHEPEPVPGPSSHMQCFCSFSCSWFKHREWMEYLVNGMPTSVCHIIGNILGSFSFPMWELMVQIEEMYVLLR